MKKHTGLDFANMIVDQHGRDSLQVMLDVVKHVHNRLSRQTAALPKPVTPTSEPHRVMLLVCERMSVTREELLGRGRTKRVAHARRTFWALLYDRVRMTMTEIGNVYARDHGTVSAALRHADARGPDYTAICIRLSAPTAVNTLDLVPGPALELAAS